MNTIRVFFHKIRKFFLFWKKEGRCGLAHLTSFLCARLHWGNTCIPILSKFISIRNSKLAKYQIKSKRLFLCQVRLFNKSKLSYIIHLISQWLNMFFYFLIAVQSFFIVILKYNLVAIKFWTVMLIKIERLFYFC